MNFACLTLIVRDNGQDKYTTVHCFAHSTSHNRSLESFNVKE